MMRFVRYIKNQFIHDRNMKRMIKANSSSLTALNNGMKLELICRRIDWLKEKVMSCTELGVTDKKYEGEEVIVSLTSFGKRINEVYLAIESIMQGTLKPNRIVLWLAENEFREKVLPQTLQRQQKRGLQIEFCDDIKSFKKIIPTIEKYPDACIVTIDDDVMYEFDLLENLIRTHLDHPNDICTCRMHRITLDEQNRPQSYLKWDMLIYPEESSNLHFLTSGGGTLFPPHCFNDEMTNRDAFMRLCPYADDIWINAMILLSGKHILKAYTHSRNGCDYLEIHQNRDDALSKENMNPEACRNDVQFRAVCDKYDLYKFWSLSS